MGESFDFGIGGMGVWFVARLVRWTESMRCGQQTESWGGSMVVQGCGGRGRQTDSDVVITATCRLEMKLVTSHCNTNDWSSNHKEQMTH